MSYLAARREDEKERRRAEILDAAEAVYIEKGWDGLAMEKVARNARLSRALVYVYFRDKEDLLFGIGERAMGVLVERFRAAIASRRTGIDQIEAIGRAYVDYAREFPHYFDFCSRFQAHASTSCATSNESACRATGDQAIGVVVQAVKNGIEDGSIRADIGDPNMMAMTLWAFTHGIIQLITVKSSDFAHHGVPLLAFTENAFSLLRRMAQSAPPA